MSSLSRIVPVRRRLLIAASILAAAFVVFASELPAAPDTTSTFTLWQLPEQTYSQMNGYVLRTAHGRVVVIDGGTAGDAGYLRGFLAALGNNVDMWFITHQHSDHSDALGEIFKKPGGIRIGKVYGSFVPHEFIVKHGSSVEVDEDTSFCKAMADANTTVTDIAPGAVLDVDGMRIEVLAARNPEIVQNVVNNQCLVLRVSDATKSVLFLADLGEEAGAKLLASPYRDRLHADYVQMAHHGQNGVSEEFYRVVNPKVCLWPTPRWLWDNDSGKGKGSGPWQTLKVRAWMEKLGVKQNLVSADGLQRVD